MRLHQLALTVLFGVALASCAPGAVAPISSEPTEQGDIRWRLAQLNGEPPSGNYGLQFSPHDWYVVFLPCMEGPCGWVTYPLRHREPGKNIRFTHYIGPFSIPDGCERPPAWEWQEYLDTLGLITGYRVINRTLILYDGEGRQALVYWAEEGAAALPSVPEELRRLSHPERVPGMVTGSR